MAVLAVTSEVAGAFALVETIPLAPTSWSPTSPAGIVIETLKTPFGLTEAFGRSLPEPSQVIWRRVFGPKPVPRTTTDVPTGPPAGETVTFGVTAPAKVP